MTTTITLDQLNALPAGEAAQRFRQCCGATAWSEGMVNLRPFSDTHSLLTQAENLWSTMTESDLLEAFSAHPQIGNVKTLRREFADTEKLASGEQAGAANADELTREALARDNLAYRDKFGFIYIVFATGKSAQQMLELLQQRLGNTRDEELRNAAAEQMKITRLRLEKMLGVSG